MQQDTLQNLVIEFENIGPLKHFQLEIRPGINIIRAPNASGKTSLIRGFASMFSNQILPEHILSLDETHGKIIVQYNGKSYARRLVRTSAGAVEASGQMLPFSDPRAFDACIAMAESAVVHRITGGGTVFQEYLENLSYGKFYKIIMSAAQELVNEINEELAFPIFEKFESLPLLVTELTNLYLRREQVESRISDLKSSHNEAVQSIVKEKQEMESEVLKQENVLSELRTELVHEEEKEKQLKGFLEIANESEKVAAKIKKSIIESKRRQEEIRKEIARETKKLVSLKAEATKLERQSQEKLAEEIKGLKDLEAEIQRINKAIILKEETIQHAEKFPEDNPKYGGRLVIEVRKDMMRRIEWLNKIIEFYQYKYMKLMTSAKLRFNRNINRALKELMMKGFENIFLDQNFGLNVIREKGIRQPIETLSASEKLTVSLMLMLAAKETFLQEFPLFILDELTLSYDITRFRQILGYIKRRVPYVIVTSLTCDETGKPTITYEA